MESRHLNPQLEVIKPNWKGNLKVDGRFVYDPPIPEKSFFDVLKWKFKTNPDAQFKKSEIFSLPSISFQALIKQKENGFIWLGHSSFLFFLNGKTIITDPVFFDIPFVKRKSVFPFEPESLKSIDYVFLSHDHRDHFDEKSLALLFRLNPGIKAFIPLGLGELIQKINKRIPFQEAGWYQPFRLDTNDFEAFCMPAKHWSRRGLSDVNKRLWCSFVFKLNKQTIYFAGDTAFDNALFEIADFFPNPDYCFLPIGAYNPRYFMKDAHTSPEESFEIFKGINGKQFIPMHYGTFDLSDEPMGEPLRRIKSCFDNVSKFQDLLLPKLGEMIKFSI